MGDFVHSQQLQFSKSNISCGVMEVHHLPDQSGTKMLFGVACALYHKANPRPTAFVIFSDTVDSERGQRLADAFVSTKVGNQIVLGPVVNPKTGNLIKVWLWELEHESFRKWYQNELANRITDES